MAWNGQLTPGGVKAMHAQTATNPLIQVINVKKIQARGDKGDRYRLVLSDGEFYTQALVASQLNHMIRDEVLVEHAVIRLQEYTCNEVHGRQLIIALGLEVVATTGERIGNPVTINESSNTSAPAAAAAPAANTATSNTSNAPATTNNGGGGGGGSANMYRNMGRSPQASHRGGGGGGAQHGSVNVTPIRHLNPYQNRWTILVRVTSKSAMRTWSNKRGSGRLFSFDCLDEEGGEIRVTSFNEAADRFMAEIKEGSVYYISKGQLKLADKRYNPLGQYELTIDVGAEVREHTGDANIERMHYNFKAIGELESTPADAIVDVVGILRSVGEVTTIIGRTSGKEMQKRNLVLMDSSSREVELTIWNETAEAFNAAVDSVVAIKSVKVSDYNGRSLSTISSSNIAVNPDIPEAHTLQGWYQSNAGNLQVSSISTAGGRSANWPQKTFADITREGLGMGEKADFIAVRGTIIYISHGNTIMYPACPGKTEEGRDCNKKVTEDSGQWRCERCSRSFPNCRWRYIFSMNVADHTGSNWLSVFDEFGEALLGISAGDLHSMQDNDAAAFEEVFAASVFKSFTFNIKAKAETYREEMKTRCNVSSARPINYSQEARSLLATIREYDSK